VSVQRSQASISRGQKAAYVVQVSTENNGSAADVTVALAAQPSGQKPTFTSSCTKGAGTASCTVSAVSDKQPVALKAQIPVAAGATSVTSVKLTATASIVTTEKWTPPSAAETVAVTAASASAKSSPSSPASVSPAGALPLGPIPNLNGVSSQLIGAGNAAGLFPAISPSATPSPSPGSPAPDSQRRPAPDSSAIAFVQPGLTGQVAGLIALAVAVMLTVTRLSLRKRFRSRKQGG
jgi:S-DNA-T family DNA segregation ATPase FtsK/SpoIIIE